MRFSVHVSNIYRHFYTGSQPWPFLLRACETFRAEEDPTDVYQIRDRLEITGVDHTQTRKPTSGWVNTGTLCRPLVSVLPSPYHSTRTRFVSTARNVGPRHRCNIAQTHEKLTSPALRPDLVRYHLAYACSVSRVVHRRFCGHVLQCDFAYITTD